MEGKKVIITKNGKEVGRFIPKETTISYFTDSLTGILKGDYDLEQVREEKLKEKYEIIILGSKRLTAQYNTMHTAA